MLYTGPSARQVRHRQMPGPDVAVGVTGDQHAGPSQASEVTGCGWGITAIGAPVAVFHSRT